MKVQYEATDINKVIEYLNRQPHGEVRNLIDMLSAGEQIQDEPEKEDE